MTLELRRQNLLNTLGALSLDDLLELSVQDSLLHNANSDEAFLWDYFWTTLRQVRANAPDGAFKKPMPQETHAAEPTGNDWETPKE